jgi:hypothetical protein
MFAGLFVGLISTLVLTAAGVWVIAAALRYRTRVMELQHQERLAMIDRGLVPPPELTPHRFVGEAGARAHARRAATKDRSLSLGIIIVGLGLAFMSLIGIAAGAPDVGLGIGGAIAILGGAFIVRSLIVGQGLPPAEIVPPLPSRPGSPAEPPGPPAAPAGSDSVSAD